MPILPPSGASPLDTVANILNASRAKLGQKGMATLASVGGKLLDWTEPGTQQTVNTAWRKMQQRLSNLGFTQLKGDVTILNIPIVTTLDPAIPQSISWTEFFDGLTILTTPTLPFDMACPLKLWERPNGQNAIWPRDPMTYCFEGLPGLPKQCWNAVWEWRAGAIYFPGSVYPMDFRLIYERILQDFADDNTTHWYDSAVPISDCMETFSCFICAEIMGTPENPNAGGWLERADAGARAMVNRESSMKQRGNIRRQSRSGRLERGGYGW